MFSPAFSQRILELNLGEIDPENIRQITSSERDSLNFINYLDLGHHNSRALGSDATA